MNQEEIDREGLLRVATILPWLKPSEVRRVWALRAQLHAIFQELGQRPQG